MSMLGKHVGLIGVQTAWRNIVMIGCMVNEQGNAKTQARQVYNERVQHLAYQQNQEMHND